MSDLSKAFQEALLLQRDAEIGKWFNVAVQRKILLHQAIKVIKGYEIEIGNYLSSPSAEELEKALNKIDEMFEVGFMNATADV